MWKARVLSLLRGRRFQPVWERLFHWSILGQNFWATNFAHSGERDVLAMLALALRKDAVIFDVGANLGEFSVAAAKTVPSARIHAFEPSQAGFEALSDTIERAQLSTRVMRHRLALGEEPHHAILHTSTPGASTASLLDLRDPYEPFEAALNEQVEVTTLDLFCAEKGIRRIDFLKVDVEGLELSVLKGASALLRSGSIDFIQFEFGAGHIDARVFMRDFFDLLGEDFALHRIVANGLHPLGKYRPEHEVFACINYLAVRREVADRMPG